MGEVYRARNPRLGRDVAVKVLPETLALNPHAMTRFHSEARAVAALSHPNIVAIHDFGNQGPVVYVVLEFLEGETLRAFLGKGSGGWRAGVEWVAAAAETIAAVHAKGIVHRDLKPDNLFITSQGVLKILDFGLASSFALTEDERTTSALTEAGTAVGTIGYMSPEQVRGQSSTAATDLFSLGCILYKVLMGKRAFQRESVADTLAAILNDPLEFGDMSRAWPEELVRITQRCLAKSPAQRFQSGRDLAFALRSILQVAPRDHAADSVGVLPFTNTGGADAEYLSDGIAESLINDLTRIPTLRVVPRSTVFRYKDTDLDPQALGRELHARLLLTGKVMQRGERLMVQADLVDATEQKQLWGERFNRPSADIFEVEDEIARQIVEKLQVKLTGEQQRQIGDRSTEDPVAYNLYLKARHHWSKRTPESICRSIEYLEAAIARDANFARAWAGLADARILFGWYGAGVIRDSFDSAILAARAAVRLDPDLGEAHAALERAQAIFGDFQMGHSALGHAYGRDGRREEALTCLHALRRSDPKCVDPYHMALVHTGLGQLNEAIASFTEASDANSTWLRIYGPHDPRLNVLRGDARLDDLLRQRIRH